VLEIDTFAAGKSILSSIGTIHTYCDDAKNGLIYMPRLQNMNVHHTHTFSILLRKDFEILMNDE
jgi:hypothetical protein